MKTSIEIEDEKAPGVATQDNSNTTKKKKSSIVKEDRLSNLPDEVIHRIFSFLDATLAVQSSVLSKRWRYLWTSLPVLNFHDVSFNESFLFHSFVEHVLSRRDPSTSVSMLQFVCDEELDDEYIVDSIIDHVIPMGIQVLSINAQCVVRNLPQLSACQSLTTLKLSDIATETTTFDFVSLKKLYLFDIRFECGVQEVLDAFRGCPNLRCLFLHGCQYYGKFQRFKIYAPQLTEFSISCLRVDQLFDSDCVIELFTPKLQSFSYHDSDLYDFSIKGDLPFVEKVDIDLGSFELDDDDDDELTKDTSLSLRLIELFEAMGSAKCVSLSFGIIEVLSMFPDLLDGRSSPFTRVQTFELNMDRSSPVAIPTNVMAFLFDGSPGF
ncbi:F-box/FBD/LRR-repeat protein At5g53840-like [Gastrolobium bilobum]|uniref:F-box/FBD/LRR-repeat protein At5g53840-like n=1 Tax=Gastrolobium bilobum TaxID=150636 RepID=UPI002AB0DD6C|nr:F-box/FBD/LRR-repeat protein At5g53840-like [Gastrolobium bilobum]XP_061359789.1 F-box/FBD/LRR-repeat protein At5g53840-like [Gastrolobium bilobum]